MPPTCRLATASAPERCRSTRPYRAGYAVVIGSDSPLSAYGVLADGYGKPVALTSGVVTPRNKSSPKLAVFTNSAGRFAVEGLSEGSWTIALDTASGHLLYQLEVVKGRDALVQRRHPPSLRHRGETR